MLILFLNAQQHDFLLTDGSQLWSGYDSLDCFDGSLGFFFMKLCF